MIVGGYLFCCIMAWLIEVDLEADCAQISIIFSVMNLIVFCVLHCTGINGLWYNYSTCPDEFRSSWNSLCDSWDGGCYFGKFTFVCPCAF